jgi:putative signal transducing protein
MAMVELLRTNDPVRLSWLTALLADAGIVAHVFDLHTSIAEGSIAAIERRLVVGPDDAAAARRLLAEAGELPTDTT